MTILIANIGTSDLAVKIEQPLKNFKERLNQLQDEELINQLDKLTDEELKQDYYLPIGFDRNEPNLKTKKTRGDSEEKIEPEDILWEYRQQIIAEELCKKWNIEFKKYFSFSFRDFTECLLEKYIKNPEIWHEHICPSRILGVIEEAKKQSVSKIYLFITDQNPKNTNDTIYLCEIIKLWLSKELDFKNIDLVPYNINKNGISAVDFDGLLSQYYQFFVERNKEKIDKLLISVKGGTPQMQTTLRIQVSSSGIANQIYLEPQLSIKKLLAGEASECNKVSYWQYQRIQKYQTVKKLLSRWDFDGARTILEEWVKTLVQLEKDGITEVGESRCRIEASIRALNIAIGYFNLATKYTQTQYDNRKTNENLEELDTLVINYPHQKNEDNKYFPKLLNLYTQCCLLWKTDRIADFLARMGSFYEEVIHELIHTLDGAKYFDQPREKGNWFLKKNLPIENNRLANKFYQLEKQSVERGFLRFSTLCNKVKNKCDSKGKWIHKLGKNLSLSGRPTKMNFLRALVEIQGSSEQIQLLEKILQAIKKLDTLYKKRNKLIHSAQGISKQRMIDEMSMDEIFNAIASICSHTRELMQTSLPPSIYPEHFNYLDPFNESHYLYSDIRRWVIETLDRDR